MVYIGPSRWQFSCHQWARPRRGRAAVWGAMDRLVCMPGAGGPVVSPRSQRSLGTEGEGPPGRRCLGPVLQNSVWLTGGLWLCCQPECPKAHFVRWFPFRSSGAGCGIGWLAVWLLKTWCLFQADYDGSCLRTECVLNAARSSWKVALR